MVQNRPRPLREFDQIYMKTGDMVLQSELVANWAENKKISFIGDGDAISVCIAYLQRRDILDFGPSEIMVFDFDERIVQAVKRFADRERIDNLDASLYNCIDAFPNARRYECFYSNPPWGAYNNGESVNVFAQRGIESIAYEGSGMLVLANDDDLPWTRQVLSEVQSFCAERGFFISRMMPKLHQYHLDDNPDLYSCNLIVDSIRSEQFNEVESKPITDFRRLSNFYGREKTLRVRYVREKKRVDYGKAHDDEYEFELLEDSE